LHRWGQQSQQQLGGGVRRSQRSSKGQLSFNYAALFGTSTQRQQMAVPTSAGGGAGQGDTGAPQQRQKRQQLQQTLMPATPAPPPRATRRGGDQ
jgi:hypothetical protein